MQSIKKQLLHFLVMSLCFSFEVSANNAWDVLRQEFKLNHHLEQPSVQDELRWLQNHPKYLQQLAHARPYLFHILAEVKKHQLPGELALIPMLESAYNPFAYSKVGAAGLWQLMPKTGDYLGVHGSWWTDDRRNIETSTTAALNYFTRLQRFFHGDWLLAIAAYDCGEGNVQRIHERIGSRSEFWQLPLPNETRHYVPRFLALAELIQHADHYGLQLPDIPYQPYFIGVELPATLDLSHAARLAGISYRDFINLNPGLNHSTASKDGKIKVFIPRQSLHLFHYNLAKLPQQATQSLKRYLVKSGDNLEKIALQSQTNPRYIAKLNNLKSDRLEPGMILYLPMQRNDKLLERYLPPVKKTRAAPKLICPQQYKILHLVQQGETMQDIAKKYAVSVEDLRQWNPRSTQNLVSSEKIWIWKFTQGRMMYTVKAGDSLQKIALSQQISLQQLKNLNPRLKTEILKPGQDIRILQ